LETPLDALTGGAELLDLDVLLLLDELLDGGEYEDLVLELILDLDTL
jgi:hypothetical protein